MDADIIIIGGGVIGAAVARELSRYELKLILVEREDDVAMGTSKGNSGIIHAGYNARAGTLKGRLNVLANPVFDELCRKLQVPFKRIGSLVVAFSDEEYRKLIKEKENGEKLGIEGLELISRDRLHEMEPNLNPEARYALYAPSAGIISPYELTIALAESSVLNGAEILLETGVTDIISSGGRLRGVETERGVLTAPLVINAAGLFADRIAALAGDSDIEIRPRKGEYHLLDKMKGGLVNHVLFPIPSKLSKGILVTPTVHGNLLLGPTSHPVEDKYDLATTEKGLEEVFAGARKLVPGLDRRDVITSFSGARAVTRDESFIIGPSRRVKGLINAGGIQSPGLTCSPAIAGMVVRIVKELAAELLPCGELRYKKGFKEGLPGRPVFQESFTEAAEGEAGNIGAKTDKKSGYRQWQELVRENPDYGEIICRCEKVSRGEIMEAIHRPIPARSLDAVKRRTRAGSGRCQGGFCSYRILKILADELGISPLQVSKKGKGSEILAAGAKELLLNTGRKGAAAEGVDGDES